MYRSQDNHTINHVNYSISNREDTHPITNENLHTHESIIQSVKCIPGEYTQSCIIHFSEKTIHPMKQN